MRAGLPTLRFLEHPLPSGSLRHVLVIGVTMPNVATVLKSEIQRLARKEVRGSVTSLRKTVYEQRIALAALKRQNAELVRRLDAIERSNGRVRVASDITSDAPDVRFSPKWVASDRKRLGLSAKDYARLVGVSELTIFNWEKGRSRPQARPLAAWAAVRRLGKRAALQRLEQQSGK